MNRVDASATSRTIVKEIFVRTTPERAFRAFTEKAELERWFVSRADVELVPGGVFNLTWGPGEHVPGNVVEVDPPHKFVFDWDDGPQYGVTRITVEFTESGVDYGARIRLVHTGFSVNANWDPLYFDVNSGWTKELEYLRAWLDVGRPKPWS